MKKQRFIEKKIQESGLLIKEIWSVRLSVGDILRLYHGWIPRVVSILRLPPLIKLDMYILEGPDAISSLYRLKHQIRREIWGFENKKGGFLHTPDSLDEAHRHKLIIKRRIVEKRPMIYAFHPSSPTHLISTNKT